MDYVDPSGQPRNYGEPFVDASGVWRNPGEGFVDADGIWREPGKGFVDSSGYWREPGEGFVDGDGIWREPKSSLRYQELTSEKPVENNSHYQRTTNSASVSSGDFDAGMNLIYKLIKYFFIFYLLSATAIFNPIIMPILLIKRKRKGNMASTALKFATGYSIFITIEIILGLIILAVAMLINKEFSTEVISIINDTIHSIVSFVNSFFNTINSLKV